MAALSVLVFLVNASLLNVPKTRQGLQCPTAPVQSITVTEVKKDCCGHPVTLSVTRKPKPGEPGFQQCNCAEKQASQTAEDRGPAKSIVFVLPAPGETPEFTLIPRSPVTADRQVANLSVDLDPPVPPPPNA